MVNKLGAIPLSSDILAKGNIGLVSNAIKYTNPGGHVNVFCEQVSKKKDGTANYRYTVEDDGIGMSEEFQKHMFESFTREFNSTTSGVQGTGLGLSVCKTFVDYLGGTIGCESSPGKGTKFTVVLPFKIQEGADYTDPMTGKLISAKAQEAEAVRVDFKGRKVLLVEDNELNREIATEILEEAGRNVSEAGDGTEALDILEKKGPDAFDFILMDIQMPRMNGYEATKEIRKRYPDTYIPVIALSANAFEEDRKASKEAGMDDHAAKPVNVPELFGTLEKYLKQEK